VIALLLVSLALGLSNLAAAIGIGVSGVDGRMRLRVALVFGLFEAGMPLLGLVLGRALSTAASDEAGQWIAGGLLAAVGVYEVIAWLRSRGSSAEPVVQEGSWSGWRLLLSGLVLSIDNLVAGFALGADHTALVTAIIIFGVVSVVMSLIGLELGARLGLALGERAELASGIVLILVGALIAAGMF
jgi:putative Mn2+ efflux pump MntP